MTAAGASSNTFRSAPDRPRARRYRLASDGFLCEVVFDPWNRRTKLLGVDAARFDHFAERVEDLRAPGDASRSTKFTLYAPPGGEEVWTDRGFRREAVIRGFFADGSDAQVWARYDDPRRAENDRAAEHDATIELARSKGPVAPELPPGLRLRVAAESDAPRLGAFLRGVFDDYPTPLEDEVILDNIATGASRFHVVEHIDDGRLLACASAELDQPRHNAEVTDCATAAEARGRGLMVCLIRSFEETLPREKRIVDLYTLARADEIGMNCAFARAGYAYDGRLVNNCRMPGGWESMNVWCRRAADALP